jgi:hypothetical protein
MAYRAIENQPQPSILRCNHSSQTVELAMRYHADITSFMSIVGSLTTRRPEDSRRKKILLKPEDTVKCGVEFRTAIGLSSNSPKTSGGFGFLSSEKPLQCLKCSCDNQELGQ